MKEPIYECEICGKTLEKWQQGKVRWCSGCQQVWQEGFNCGLQFHDKLMNAESITEAAAIMKGLMPYLVRE